MADPLADAFVMLPRVSTAFSRWARHGVIRTVWREEEQRHATLAEAVHAAFQKTPNQVAADDAWVAALYARWATEDDAP